MSDTTKFPAENAGEPQDLPARDAQADGADVTGGGIGTSPTAPQPSFRPAAPRPLFYDETNDTFPR